MNQNNLDQFYKLLFFSFFIAESSDKTRKRRAKVAFSYTAENEDELSLALGDVVEILGDDEEGWWRGRVNGKEGVFPCNFVEPIPEEEEPPPYTNLIDTNPPPAPSKHGMLT